MVERLRIITVIFFIAVSVFFISITYPTSALAEITIDSPASGATVGGIVAVDVSYSGTFDAPIYYIGGGLFYQYFNPPEISGTYTFYWDTSGIPNGTSQTIYLADSTGASSVIVVTVNNPHPELNITSPGNGAVIPSIQTTLPVTVTYNNVSPNYHGIRWISLVTSGNFVNGINVSGNPSSGTYTWNLNISSYPLGANWLLAYCEDASGKGTYKGINFRREEISVPVVPHEKEVDKGNRQVVAEPIEVATGNMFTTQADIAIPAREIPLELTRTYNSQDDFNGSFGWGWRSNFDITLTEQADNSVIEVDETGVYTVYTKNTDGTYTPSAGKYSILTRNPDGTYTILRKHGRKLYFNNQGRLTRIEERNGNAINILRTAEGIISEASDSQGRKLLFTQGPLGYITQVTDPANRVFKYEYDSSGNLIKRIDPLSNLTTYQYDSNHNLTCQTDANNNSFYFEYDASDRAYHSWQNNNNNEVTLSFDTPNKTTTVTDSLGNLTKYEYNDYGLVTQITDSQSKIQSFSWDNNLNKTSVTDQNGNTVYFNYDAKGNLISVKDPLNNITTFTYEPDYNLINGVTNALGNLTEYFYDAKGNLIRIKDSLGNNTKYNYDVSGQLTQIEDANSNISVFNYDSYGNLIKLIDALNNQTSFSYDLIGNIVQITDAKGNAANFTYDALNRLTRKNYADNSMVTYSYDAAGNLLSFTNPDNKTSSFTYDLADRLTQVTDALGNSTKYTYDTEGNRLSVTDGNLNKTQYTYDSLNRLIKTLDALNNQAALNYDAVGNVISKTSPNGNTIYYVYDVLNRLIEKGLSPKGSALDSVILYAYDALGRRISMTDPSGTTTYVYNPLNRLIQVDGPLDNDLIRYTFDKLGNRVQMITQSSGTINYTYDNLNRLTSLTDAQGKITVYSYDSTHNLTQINYPNNTKINYSFDKLNRLLSLANTQDTNTISSYAYEYNLSGMRTKVTLADGTYINYTYDGLSRLTSESKSDPSGAGIYNAAYQYDNVGNRLNYSKTDYHGFNDDFNRANSLDAGGLWNETTGDWQIDNNRLFMPNAETDAVIIYSGQDIANPVIETTVRLETVGNKKGSYIVFGYQSRNDFYYAGLEGISDLWVMGHYQNGVYNDLKTFSQPIEKLIDYHLKVTVKDNVVTIENLENGVWVKKLSNNFGSLPIGKVGLSVEKSRTQFDDFKIAWQSTSNTAYSYNQGNQLTQSITDSQSTSYSYDRNGNLTQKTGGINPTEYAYDYANRLLSVIASGSEATYTYDGLGKRISKSVNGQLTKYVYDSASIIFAQTPQESITYTNSLAIDSPISMKGEVTAESYYHSDGLGSITNLTNSVGQSVQSYQYDAFGNMLSSQGSISSPYAYTARELDSESGLYYYRNRYYDPKVGRFITQDPIGILDDINLYAYVFNNPINYIDPYGLCKAREKAEVPWWVWGGLIVATIEPTPYGEIAAYPMATKYLIESGIITVAIYQATRGPGPEPYPGYSKGKEISRYKRELSTPALPQHNPPPPPSPESWWKKLLDKLADLLGEFQE